MIITNWLKEPSPFGTARLCDHLSVCFVLINLQQSMVKLPLSAQVGPVSRVAGHAKLCNLGGLGPVEDMPTPRSSPESEYQSTDRGSEANCEEEAKENRCPPGHGRRH